ncbi:hypothetical protein H5T53_06935 [Candidatus Bipolaricaulota bacterium]|nr:hypothetical protein [Candidatus Bipolaricaulota bacterium]
MENIRQPVVNNSRWILFLVLALALGLGLAGCALFPWLAPPAPIGVAASDGIYSDKVVVSWQAVARADRYRVYRAESEDGSYIEIGQSTTTTYQDTTVAVNVTYWYKVKACNAAGCSDFSAPDSGYAQGAGVPSVPTGVAASDGAFLNRVRVTWTAAIGATRYEVYRDVAEAGPYNLRGIATGTSFDDTDVVPGRVYWYKVRACSDAGCSAFSAPDSGFTVTTPPEPPTGVAASDGTYSDRVRVTWNASAATARYEVYRSSSETGTYTKLGETTTTSYSDTTVTVGTVYWYRVKACNAAGCSDFSAPDSGYAQTGGGGGGTPSLPGQVKNVSASDGTYTDKIRVTWGSVSGATRYEVYRSMTGNEADFVQIAETTTTSYDDVDDTGSPVALCDTYWYAVKACNTAGCGPMSVANDGYRGTRVTGVPTVSASEGYPDKVRVTWTAVAGADKYEVWRSDASTGTYIKIGEPTALTYDDTAVTPGSSYWYKVKACSNTAACGCGGFSGPVQGRVACNPAAPTNLTATLDAPNVNLAWDVVTGAIKYEVYRSTTLGGAYTKIGEVTGSPPATTYTDTPGAGTYYYKVKTCITCGCGPLSSAAGPVTVP